MPRFVSILTAFAAVPCLAAPVGINLDFENGNTGWTFVNAGIESGPSHKGTHHVDLRNGHIKQTFTGLTPGASHTLRLAYRSQAPTGQLHHAEISIDGTIIGMLHLGKAGSGETNEYLSANAFEFIPSAATATLRLRSLQTGSAGLLIDSVRIDTGPPAPPPAASWSSLVTVADARGGRRLVNGTFESAIGTPASSPDNCGPSGNDHLSGLALPGWRVTRTNVDVIQFDSAAAPDGANALDMNGHGPGGIAQKITGLKPGAAYTLSFLYARHLYWGTEPMTGEVLANGRIVASLSRTTDHTWDKGYKLKKIPVLASTAGTLTIEIRSTTIDQGGSLVYDDIRLSRTPDSGGDGFAHSDGFLFDRDPRAVTRSPDCGEVKGTSRCRKIQERCSSEQSE